MAWIRKNVWDLIATPGDQTLEWYARGVAAMQRRPITDPTSWLFQGAVHGRPGWPGDPPPESPWALVTRDVRETFWDQCQHRTWFFLSWHRMYVGYFERIVRAAIVAEGGPEDWALPYWNYSASAEQALLPTPFRQPSLENGSPNPLFITQRNPRANAGEPFLEPRDVELSALEVDEFYVPSGETGTSFAGPETLFAHFGPSSGALESLPHNAVHVQAGLPDGWMIDPNLAALDPIFWLHHSNIDRLWDAWLQGLGHANTSVAAWTTDVAFDFHDEAGVPQRLTSGLVSDAASSVFEYTYDDLSPAAPSPLIAAAARITVPKPKATLAAATSQPTPLSQRPVAVSVPRAAASPRAARAAFTAAPTRFYLSLEGITADKPAGAYDIFVGLEGQPESVQEQFVARLAPFGVAAASDPNGPHRGAGLSETFDISTVVSQLRASGASASASYKVSIVPVNGANDAAVKVGRIAIYEG
jgi:tyrosinase